VIGPKAIEEVFPRLYLLTFSVNIYVAKVLNEGRGVI
jgi:hypothetical protein